MSWRDSGRRETEDRSLQAEVRSPQAEGTGQISRRGALILTVALFEPQNFEQGITNEEVRNSVVRKPQPNILRYWPELATNPSAGLVFLT